MTLLSLFRKPKTEPDFVYSPDIPPAEDVPEKRTRRYLKAMYPREMLITVLVGNPKRVGTQAYALFETYYACKTVGDVLDQGIGLKYLDDDIEKGYVMVEHV